MHAAIDVDGVGVEGSVGVDAEAVREVKDEGAGSVDVGDGVGFEAAEDTVKFMDSSGDDDVRTKNLWCGKGGGCGVMYAVG